MSEINYLGILLTLVQIAVGIIVVWKLITGKPDKRFLKRTNKVIEYLKQQNADVNLGKFVETTLSIMTNRKITQAQIDQINGFIKQIMGVS